MVAVGEHEKVQVPACRHHLVERAELFKAQRSLVVVCVRLLHTRYKEQLWLHGKYFGALFVCLYQSAVIIGLEQGHPKMYYSDKHGNQIR